MLFGFDLAIETAWHSLPYRDLMRTVSVLEGPCPQRCSWHLDPLATEDHPNFFHEIRVASELQERSAGPRVS